MVDTANIALVVVGSVALDTVATPSEKRENVLGGSASYACTAASFFGTVGMVGVVGTDFSDAYGDIYKRRGIDLEGLQKVSGKTFRWAGEYEENMNNRRTISVELNVFAGFRPSLPASYRKSPFLFLGNISPELQLHVLSEADKPRFVAADTMDLWIDSTNKQLLELISRVDMLMLNDSEARMLAGERNIVKAARKILGMGPEYVVVKKGEHGAALFSQSAIPRNAGQAFMVPAYPLEKVCDPTGAGDAFAGGFMGALAEAGKVGIESMRASMLYGSVMASFGVEAFSIDRFITLNRNEIDSRFREFREMMAV